MLALDGPPSFRMSRNASGADSAANVRSRYRRAHLPHIAPERRWGRSDATQNLRGFGGNNPSARSHPVYPRAVFLKPWFGGRVVSGTSSAMSERNARGTLIAPAVEGPWSGAAPDVARQRRDPDCSTFVDLARRMTITADDAIRQFIDLRTRSFAETTSRR